MAGGQTPGHPPEVFNMVADPPLFATDPASFSGSGDMS